MLHRNTLLQVTSNKNCYWYGIVWYVILVGLNSRITNILYRSKISSTRADYYLAV